MTDPNPSRRGRHRRRLSPDAERRLLDVAVRRVAGQPWKEIAHALGWHSKQAAQQWSRHAIERYWEYQDR